MLDCDDASPRPLTEKILERPRLIERIKAAILDPDHTHMVVFNSTPLEPTLSVRLGVSLNACDPALVHLGHKTGSRRVFQAAGLAVAPGREGLRDRKDLVEALASLWAEIPSAKRMVVKLDDSFSGEGNALLDLTTIADFAPGRASELQRQLALGHALESMRFEAAGLDWPTYASQFDAMGGVCELWIEGEGKRSPSVQMRIKVLAERGVIGRFGIDFLTVPRGDGTHTVYAVEINMRQGGTTHPFRSPRYRGPLPFDLIDQMVMEGIHFRSNETGVVFHWLGCLSEYGKLGLTAIAPDVAGRGRCMGRRLRRSIACAAGAPHDLHRM